MAAPTISSVTVCSSSTSITIASGEALVWIGGNHQGNVTGVTFNGTAMTEICAANTAYNENVHIFYLASPSAGTYNCIPTFSGGSGNRGDAIVISGQKTSGQPIAFNTNGNTTSLTQVSPSDNCLYIGGSYGEATLTMDTGLGLTSRDNWTGNSYENFACASAANDAGSQSFHWTQSSGQRNAIASIAIESTTSTNFPIQKDVFVSGSFSSNVSSKTVSVTVANQTNRVLVVHIGLRDTTTADMVVSGVTYNSNALTKLRSDLWNTSTYVREEIWYIVAPTVGTYNVVVTATGTCAYISCAISVWYGVDQTTPLEANAGSGTLTTGSETSTPSTNITPSSNNNVILDSIWHKNLNVLTCGSAQSEIAVIDVGAGVDMYGASYKRQATAGATSMAWSTDTSDGYAHGVGVLKPASTSSSSVKTVVGLALASVKTMEGLAIASMKTLQGLA